MSSACLGSTQGSASLALTPRPTPVGSPDLQTEQFCGAGDVRIEEMAGSRPLSIVSERVGILSAGPLAERSGGGGAAATGWWFVSSPG